jgi:hypothetical protein
MKMKKKGVRKEAGRWWGGKRLRPDKNWEGDNPLDVQK